MNATATTAENTAGITAEDAYVKGWNSAAKDPAAAAAKFAAKHGAAAAAAWTAGNTDKATGARKWSGLEQLAEPAEDAQAVLSLVPELDPAADVDAEPAAAEPETAAEDAAAADPVEPAAEPAPAAETDAHGLTGDAANLFAEARPRQTPTVAELRAQAAADGVAKDDARKMRETAAAMRRHYRLGWNYYGRHGGDLQKALTAYYGRHAARKLRPADFMDGFEARDRGDVMFSLYA